jgi:hypothetical protein
MFNSHQDVRASGQVRIEIASSDPDSIQVTVARSCNNPVILELVDEILNEIYLRRPKVVVKNAEPDAPLGPTSQKRGGPAGMPDEKRIEIVQGWFKVQGRMKQALYANSQGISPATLRRWIREMRETGKL